MNDENRATREDHDKVYQVIMGSVASQVVRTLALMSVAEHLHGNSLTADLIAAREFCDPDMTYRLLRAGATLGFLEYEADTNLFVGTPLLDVLREDSPLSLKFYAELAPGAAFWPAFLLMPETIRDGKTHVVEALGTTVFEFYAEHIDQGRKFSAAMRNLSTPVIRDAASAIRAQDARYVVDVGGADGAFVAELLQRNPGLTGAVLDLPQVVPTALETPQAQGLQGRMTGIAGDFFHEIPPADIYLLKFVLHDWDDEASIRVLSNIRTAMNPGARIFIVEMAITDDTSLSATLMDMAMLANFTGQERELTHFQKLLRAAGLEMGEPIPLRPPYYLIEAHS